MTAYDSAPRQVIDSYGRDFDDHKPDFLPIFLANDISRYWKVLCISYEAVGPPLADVPELVTRRPQRSHPRVIRWERCVAAWDAHVRRMAAARRDMAFIPSPMGSTPSSDGTHSIADAMNAIAAWDARNPQWDASPSAMG